MSKRKLYAIVGKLCMLALLLTFSFESFDVHRDVSVFEAIGYGFSFNSFSSFVLAVILLAAYVQSLRMLCKLDTANESNNYAPVAILWFLSGVLCMITSMETEWTWWLTLIISIVATVASVLIKKEEDGKEKLLSPSAIRKISRVVLLLVVFAFFQPVACGESSYEVIGDYLFEFDDAVFIGAWLLLSILVVAICNTIGHFVHALDKTRLFTTLEVVLCVALAIFFCAYMMWDFGFGFYLEELEIGYWNILTCSILAMLLERKSGLPAETVPDGEPGEHEETESTVEESSQT